MRQGRTWRALSFVFAGSIASTSAAPLSAMPASNGDCATQITFLSDTPGDSYKYLEEQQRQIYEQNPGLADPYSLAELRSPRAVANFAELKRRALEACPDPALRSQCALDPDLVDKLFAALPCLKLGTRFESPLFASLISLDSEELDKVRLKHYPNSVETRFGSLPTGTFDAQAILPPGSRLPLVILNRDIFFFTGALSKSISDAMPIAEGPWVALNYSDGAVRQRLKDHPYIVHNFADAMSRLVRNGSSGGAIEVTLDELHNHLHARLVSAMDMFLIAHEQSHVILNHVSDQSVAFQLAGSGKVRITSMAKPKIGNLVLMAPVQVPRSPTMLKAELRTREQEFAADALGLRLLIWTEQEKQDPIAEMVGAAAPHMVFRILDAANAYGREAGGWTFGDANHPTAIERIAALRSVFAELAQDDQVLKQADFRVAFDAVFKVLLAEADSEIRQNLGLRPVSKTKR